MTRREVARTRRRGEWSSRRLRVAPLRVSRGAPRAKIGPRVAMFPRLRRAAPEKTTAPAVPTLDPTTAPAAPKRGVEQDFDPEVLLRRFPPYKVVVHDNSYNTFDEVIRILLKA